MCPFCCAVITCREHRNLLIHVCPGMFPPWWSWGKGQGWARAVEGGADFPVKRAVGLWLYFMMRLYLSGEPPRDHNIKTISRYASESCIYPSEGNYFLQFLPITDPWESVGQEVDLGPSVVTGVT